MVYASDISHPADRPDPAVVELARDAGLLIHDAQYTPAEKQRYADWGHSSWTDAVAVAEQANVQQLALFHHDPLHTDDDLEEIERQAQAVSPGAFIAREGMQVAIE